MTQLRDGTHDVNGESELDRLATLQELDRHLHDKTELAATLEREAADMTLELSTLRQALAAVQAEHQARDQQRRDQEARLDDEGTKMKDRRMRLNRVRNEKELSALRREIELGKEANQQLETEVLSSIEAVEGLEVRVRETTQALAAMEEQYAGGIASRRERIAALTSEVAGERVARDRVADSLSDELRSKYEQIFARRRGTTVVEIRNGTCTGCHMHVPPQFFNELQKSRDVRLCPNCHRILYWRPESATSAEPLAR